MPEIRIEPSGARVHAEPGENLLDVLRAAGCAPPSPCGGAGTCGKCRVRILEGDFPAPDEQETHLLARGARADERISCLLACDADAAVFVEEPPEPALPPEPAPRGGSATVPSAPPPTACGIAADVGTTTVACALVDLETGAELARAQAVNGQVPYGADVLSRISYEAAHGDAGIRRLQAAVVATLDMLAGKLCAEVGAAPKTVGTVTVAANCVMNHLLMGVDATPIGRAPYTPAFTGQRTCRAAELGFSAIPDALVTCLPSASGYVGGDIVAGAFSCGLQGAEDRTLMVDIGTNGELVLADGGALTCCSCAAGPALEGMGVQAGMSAVPGAVEDLRITPDGVGLEVIGGGAARGLCGSGVLAAIRELRAAGMLDDDGALAGEDDLAADDPRTALLAGSGGARRLLLATGGEAGGGQLAFTQADVRQVQLATGAIRAGMSALVEEAGLRFADLDRLVVAGQFGAHLPVESLVAAGLVPAELAGRVEYVGNSSLAGALLALRSEAARHEMSELAARMRCIDLARSARYQELFVDCLAFPEFPTTWDRRPRKR